MKLQIKQTGIVYYVDSNEIIYCRAERSYCRIFLTNKEIVCSKPLSDLSTRLNPTIFIRIHHSYLINLDFVDKEIRVNDHLYVLMRNGKRLPVSRNRRGLFQVAMNNFLTKWS